MDVFMTAICTSNAPTEDDELLKRAFWVLVALDRTLSSGLGRPTATQEEDFDIGYMAECDDEFWDHLDPVQAWRQPAGKPSTIAAFNTMLRLNRVLAQVHRTIYSINKHKAGMNLFNEECEEWVVTELDSLLNRWVDTIPSHLKWDPENELWLQQSAWLHTSYYNVQILVHRPFISSSKAPKKPVLSSFAICTNAARSTARILNCLIRRIKPPFLISRCKNLGGVMLVKYRTFSIRLPLWATSLSNIEGPTEYGVRQEASDLGSDAHNNPEFSHDSADVNSQNPGFKGGPSPSSYAAMRPETELQPLPMYTTELGKLPFEMMDFSMLSGSQTSFVPEQLQQEYVHNVHAQPTTLQSEGPKSANGEHGNQFQSGFQFAPQNTAPFEEFSEAASSFEPYPFAQSFLNPFADVPIGFEQIDEWESYLKNLGDFMNVSGNEPDSHASSSGSGF